MKTIALALALLAAPIAAHAQQAAPNQPPSREELMLRTIAAQRDAAMGEARLAQMDLEAAKKELDAAKRKLAEKDAKAK